MVWDKTQHKKTERNNFSTSILEKNGRKEYKKRIIYEPTTHKNTHSKMRETTLVNNCENCIIKLKNDPKVSFHLNFSWRLWERIEREFDIKSRLVDAHSVILDGRGCDFSHFDIMEIKCHGNLHSHSINWLRSYHNGKCTQMLNNFL